MPCCLGVLVYARGLLHQSKPPIEDRRVNKLSGYCKANRLDAELVRSDPDSPTPTDDRVHRTRTYPSLRAELHHAPHSVLRNIP
jgi:hypothetical protein